jgi:hypothetical protein
MYLQRKPIEFDGLCEGKIKILYVLFILFLIWFCGFILGYTICNHQWIMSRLKGGAK